jgi:hypothetical protein
MIHGAEHLVVSAIEFVPAEGFCTAAIRRIRLYNHGCSVPRQNSSSDGKSMTVKPMRVIEKPA